MRTNHFLFLSVMLLILSSCSLFNEEPRSGLAQDDIIIDATSLYRTTIAPLYSQIGSSEVGRGLYGTYRGVYDLNTFTTDEAIIPLRGGDWNDGGLWQSLFLHTWEEDNEAVTNAWDYLFGEVVRCNIAIATIEKHSDLLTDAQHVSYISQARAIRALYYYYLVDMFASVPIITSATDDVSTIYQSSRSQVFRFVWDELQDVLPNLTTDHSNLFGEYYAHITQPVVCFLLSKLALNAEIYTDDCWTDAQFVDGKDVVLTCSGNSLNAWQATIFYVDMLYSFGYDLDPWQSNCFAVHNEQSVENIFTIPMDKSQYTSRFRYQFRSMHYKHGAALGYGGENGSCATLETIRTFGYATDTCDNRFVSTFFADTVYAKGNVVMLSNGDTLVYYPLKVENDLTNSPYIATAGARMYKYEIDPTGIFDGTLRENDIVLFRYADALLMKAEAKLRLGEDADAELNAVRSRSAMKYRKATLESIYDERLLELMWEGTRRQDMIRYRKFTASYPLSNRPSLSGEEPTWGYTTVFPIPLSAISTNKNLKQNQGY